MDTTKIKYCNNNGFLIKNDRNKYNILKKINNIVGYNVLNTNYKIYSDRLIHSLKHPSMLATYITIGKPCLIFLTKLFGENVTLIIEKTVNDNNLYPKIVSVLLNFDEILYTDTLISAEIYRHGSSWYLIIDTLLIYKGFKVSYSNVNNIKMINKITDGVKYNPVNLCKVISKKFISPNNIGTFLNKTNLRLKGLKFIKDTPIYFHFDKRSITYNNNKNLPELPENNSYLITEKLKELKNANTNKKLIRQSHKQSPIFILELRKTKFYGIYNLFAKRDSSTYEKLGVARIETIEISSEIINKLTRVSKFNIEADYDYNFDKFRVLKLTHNRNISTYKMIKKSI